VPETGFAWPRFLPKTAEKRRLIFASIIGGLILIFAAHATGRVWSGYADDFKHFYRAAHGMLRGENIYAAGLGRYVYPPLLAFLLQPLGLLSLNTAATLWILVNVALVLTAVVVATTEITNRWMPESSGKDLSIRWAIAAFAVVLAADKIHIVFTQGQTDFVMLLGFACVLRWMERRPWLAGLAIGFIANIKYFSLIFVPYFLLKKNFRAAFSSLATFVFFLWLPAIEVGLKRTTEYLTIAGGGLLHMTGAQVHHLQRLYIRPITWDHSVSITSAVFRMSRGRGLPDGFAVALLILVFCLGMLLLIIAARRAGVRLVPFGSGDDSPQTRQVTSLEWAILIGIALAFSPQATARHMVLALLLYAVGGALLLLERVPKARRLLVVALLAMAGATSLPPPGLGPAWLLNSWRAIGGAGWCGLFLTVVLVWIGSRTARDAMWPRGPQQVTGRN